MQVLLIKKVIKVIHINCSLATEVHQMTTMTLCPPYEALDLCIKLLDLEVKGISQKSGVSESQISRYRKGKADMGTESFRKLIQALPDKARSVMIRCLVSHEMTKEQVFSELTR